MKWAILILIAIVLNIITSEVSILLSPYAYPSLGHITGFLAAALPVAAIAALVSGGAVIPKANRHKFPRYFSLTFLGFSAVWGFMVIGGAIFA